MDVDGDGCSAYSGKAAASSCGVAGYTESCERCCRSCAHAPNCHPDARFYSEEDRWDVLATQLGNFGAYQPPPCGMQGPSLPRTVCGACIAQVRGILAARCVPVILL